MKNSMIFAQPRWFFVDYAQKLPYVFGVTGNELHEFNYTEYYKLPDEDYRINCEKWDRLPEHVHLAHHNETLVMFYSNEHCTDMYFSLAEAFAKLDYFPPLELFKSKLKWPNRFEPLIKETIAQSRLIFLKTTADMLENIEIKEDLNLCLIASILEGDNSALSAYHDKIFDY